MGFSQHIHLDAPSLKNFYSESSIIKEVKTWTEDQRESYIQSHEHDTRPSSFLIKKIKIVKHCQTFLDTNDSGTERKRYINDNKIPLETLILYAPESCLDPKNTPLKSHQKNTGVYLWSQGYNPKKFLGAGCNGVAWICTDDNGNNPKAIKVTRNRSIGPFTYIDAISQELRETKRINNMNIPNQEIEGRKHLLKKDKYLALPTLNINDYKNLVISSELAERDLVAQNQRKTSKYSINKVLKQARELLKGLDIIHQAGYSHNDVKPDNILIFNRKAKLFADDVKRHTKSKNLTDDELKEKRPIMSTIKIADFGGITEINKTRKIWINKYTYPPDWYKLSPAAVEKRDSYGAGCCILYILIECKDQSKIRKIAQELERSNPSSFYEKYGLKEKYCLKQGKLNEKAEQAVINLLITIQLMVKSSYTSRLSIEDSLKKVKSINYV